MTLDELRERRRLGELVRWMGLLGTVTRIARDGSWADMIWIVGNQPYAKRQHLTRLEDWR